MVLTVLAEAGCHRVGLHHGAKVAGAQVFACQVKL